MVFGAACSLVVTMDAMNKIVYNDTIDKLYYTISEVSKEIGVKDSKIRFWCEKLLFSIKRDRKGNRQFTKGDIDVLIIAKHLIQEKRFTLEGARVELGNRGLKIYHQAV